MHLLWTSCFKITTNTVALDLQDHKKHQKDRKTYKMTNPIENQEKPKKREKTLNY